MNKVANLLAKIWQFEVHHIKKYSPQTRLKRKGIDKTFLIAMQLYTQYLKFNLFFNLLSPHTFTTPASKLINLIKIGHPLGTA